MDSLPKTTLLLGVSENDVVIPVHVDHEVTFGRRFNLVSLICHSGSVNKGHYYTYARHGTDWFRINDKAVLRIADLLVTPSLDIKESYVALYLSE